MKNLIKAIQQENESRKAQFLKDIRKEKEVSDKITYGHYRQLLPSSKKGYQWKDDKEIKAYLVVRYNKVQDGRLEKELQRIETVSKAGELDSIVVNVEFKRSAMWGYNPSAEAQVDKKDGTRAHYSSGSIGGCGYDKESTAVAQALSQSNELLKLLYERKNKNIQKSNHDLFGYGAGYGLLPYIEGGVGVSCYRAIFEKIGFTFSQTSNGKMFSVFTISKKK